MSDFTVSMTEKITTGTALALPEPTALAALFRSPKGVLSLIERIEQEARSHAPDLTTVKGRDAIKSLAFKVAKSKTALDDAGKALNEDARAQINAVDAERRVVRERLDKLRDEVRKPLDDWEAAEADRVAKLKLRLDAFRPQTVPASADGLRALIAEVEAQTVDATWQEYEAEAASLKAMCLNRLDEHLAAAVERERIAAEAATAAAELAQLRAEKLAREEADRLAREAVEAEARRIEAERIEAERQRIAAEKAEAARVAAEKAAEEQAARIEAEKQAAAKLAAEQAETRARAEAARQAREAADREAAMILQRQEDEARHQREMAEAKAREEAAAQAERDRLAAQQKAAQDAAAKRAADQAHRQRIRSDIAASLNGFCDELDAWVIADAIMDGKIPHVEVLI